MAVIYDRTGYYRKGLVYFQKALALFTQLKDSANLANALNNIGLVYKELKLDDSARYFFYKSLPMQLRLKNYYGIINLNNNLGELMLEAKKYHEALRYFQISQETIRNDDSLFWGSKLYLIVATDFEMAKTFQQMKENTRALGYYRKVDSSAGTAGFLAFKTGALKGLSEVFDQTGDADSALKYARLHLVYYDSLRKIEDNQRMAVIEYEFNYKMEKEKEQLEKERQEALENRKELKFMLIIFTIVALSVLLFLLYLLQRNKLNRINLVKMNLQLEKSNLQKDLDLKNRELTTKVMSLIEQNELLAYLSQRLTKIIQTSDTKDSGLLHDVVHDIQYQHSEGFWEEFNLHFKEVHGDFYNRLSKAYPQLTLNEIKLCAFLKLNLSTKEISKVTRKSEQSLKIARYRLRQKLDLNREDNLTIFLSKF